ncbi:MAG: flagellar motor switch protein FliM [Gemmatimonadetes bacterium]|jgi:flagellar motor switch protein FliM|nr:flagellar motor switch protein FliM [Gemmatimonadota bacterium]MBT7860087.1 flagellar motor switch protein FliM [Gemmatimonadota bacterium]
MPDELSDDELHELISAARASKSPATRVSGGAAMSYDFRRPQQVNKDQARRMESVHEQFARLLAATISSNMRQVVDVDLAFCDQLVYNEFIVSLPSPGTAYSFVMGPHGGQAILSLANDLVMAIIDRAFGGQGRSFTGGDDRGLTQIEMNIINKLASRIFADLEATWEPVGRVEIAEVTLEANPEFIQIAAPGDGCFIVAFEANTRSATGLVHLCYPLGSLEPLADQLSPKPGNRNRQVDRAQVDQQRRALGKMKIPVHLQVARGALSLNEIAQLQEGDVVTLDTQKDEPSVLFVGGRPKYLARPGLSGRKRAAKLLDEIDPDSEDLYG